MKKKYIVLIAAIVLVIAFCFIIFKIISNKRIDAKINDDYSRDAVLLTIGTMEPDNSKSFIFVDGAFNNTVTPKDNYIILVKGYTGITGKFTVTNSETISNKKYNKILNQLENATKCEHASSDCYSVSFRGKETYFVKQSDLDLKY